MVILLANEKGGVSKTISTLNVAASLSKSGKKCLIIDFDPQCNITFALDLFNEAENNVVDFLNGEYVSVIEKESNLFIMPGSRELYSFNYKLNSLDKAIKNKSKNGMSFYDFFDFIFIDVASVRISPFSKKNKYYFESEIGLYASDYFAIPLLTEAFSLNNAVDFLNQVLSFKNNHNKNLQFLGFFFNKVLEHRSSFKNYSRALKNYNEDFLFKHYVRQDSNVDKAILKGGSLIDKFPLSRASVDFEYLANELTNKINKNGK